MCEGAFIRTDYIFELVDVEELVSHFFKNHGFGVLERAEERFANFRNKLVELEWLL